MNSKGVRSPMVLNTIAGTESRGLGNRRSLQLCYEPMEELFIKNVFNVARDFALERYPHVAC